MRIKIKGKQIKDGFLEAVKIVCIIPYLRLIIVIHYFIFVRLSLPGLLVLLHFGSILRLSLVLNFVPSLVLTADQVWRTSDVRLYFSCNFLKSSSSSSN